MTLYQSLLLFTLMLAQTVQRIWIRTKPRLELIFVNCTGKLDKLAILNRLIYQSNLLILQCILVDFVNFSWLLFLDQCLFYALNQILITSTDHFCWFNKILILKLIINCLFGLIHLGRSIIFWYCFIFDFDIEIENLRRWLTFFELRLGIGITLQLWLNHNLGRLKAFLLLIFVKVWIFILRCFVTINLWINVIVHLFLLIFLSFLN